MAESPLASEQEAASGEDVGTFFALLGLWGRRGSGGGGRAPRRRWSFAVAFEALALEVALEVGFGEVALAVLRLTKAEKG